MSGSRKAVFSSPPESRMEPLPVEEAKAMGMAEFAALFDPGVAKRKFLCVAALLALIKGAPPLADWEGTSLPDGVRALGAKVERAMAGGDPIALRDGEALPRFLAGFTLTGSGALKNMSLEAGGLRAVIYREAEGAGRDVLYLRQGTRRPGPGRGA